MQRASLHAERRCTIAVMLKSRLLDLAEYTPEGRRALATGAHSAAASRPRPSALGAGLRELRHALPAETAAWYPLFIPHRATGLKLVRRCIESILEDP